MTQLRLADVSPFPSTGKRDSVTIKLGSNG